MYCILYNLYFGRVDVFDNEGRSALHLAAEGGSMEVIKQLLDKNAFVNSKTKLGWTALHYAAHKVGLNRISNWQMWAGSLISEIDCRIIKTTVMQGFTELAAYLVQAGATLDGMTIKKQTPMHLAAAAGRRETCQKLLELEASIDSNDDADQKPIHLAAQNDHTDLVQLFLETRPSLVASTTKDGNTLAHLAAKKGSTDVLKAMFAVDKALVTNARNRFNQNSPLHLATEGGHIESVKLMLENGVSPTDENNDGFTPVHLAAKCGHADIFDTFAKVNTKIMMVGKITKHFLVRREFEAAELENRNDGASHRQLFRGGGDHAGVVQAHPGLHHHHHAHQAGERANRGALLRS